MQECVYCVGNTLRTLCCCVHRQSHQHKHTCWMDIGTAPSAHTSRLPCSEEETATILYESIEKTKLAGVILLQVVLYPDLPTPAFITLQH